MAAGRWTEGRRESCDATVLLLEPLSSHDKGEAVRERDILKSLLFLS
jgi:hypothetical protein